MESNFTTMTRKSEQTEENQPDLTYPYRKGIGSALWYARRNFRRLTEYELVLHIMIDCTEYRER